MIRSLAYNQTFRNAGWIVGGRVAQMGVQLFLSLLTARYLGPGNYGLLSYAAAYTGFFSSLCTLGIPSVLVKELLDHPGSEGEILGSALLLRMGASLLSSLAVLGIVFVADRGDREVLLVAGLSCGAMVLRNFEVFYCWFQSRLRARVLAVTALAAYLLASVYRAALLVLGKGVIWFAAASVLEQGTVAVLFLRAYRSHGGTKLAVSLERGKAILKKSCHFILPGLMVAVYGQTDKIMLKQYAGPSGLACYSAAMSLSTVWCFVLSAVIDSSYPGIAQAYQRDKRLFRRKNKQLYAFVFYLCMAVSVVLSLLAEPLVALLYGQEYLGAAAPLRILAWSAGFSYLGVARNAWVVCENRQRKLVWAYAAAAAVNVGLNLLWIPRWGAAGAAGASLAAQVVTTVAAPFFIRDLRENAVLMMQALALRGIWKGDLK